MELQNLKVLSIGSDRKSFDESSPVFERLSCYAEKMDSFYVIIFTKRGYTKKTVGNLHIYPTNSFSRMFYVSDAKKLVKQIIESNDLTAVDTVVSTQDPFESGLVGYFVHKKFNLPLQLQIHTDFLSTHFNQGFLNRIRVIIGSFLIPKAQGLRVVSDVIKESIQKKFPRLTTVPEVLPIFVDVDAIINKVPEKNLEKGLKDNKFIICMASRLTKEKRIDVAIEAVARLIKEFPHTALVIAGSGNQLNYLKNKSRKLGVEKNIMFIGWQNDLVSLFKTSDLYLLTSAYEGYGMSLIEAGASGCPIVTTNVGVAKTSLFKNGENCFVCPVDDVSKISDAISKMIHNNTTREVFRRKMQEDIKNTSVNQEEYVSKYVSLLSNLLKK